MYMNFFDTVLSFMTEMLLFTFDAALRAHTFRNYIFIPR